MKLKSLRIPEEAKTDLGLKHDVAAVKPPLHLRLVGRKITDAGNAFSCPPILCSHSRIESNTSLRCTGTLGGASTPSRHGNLSQ